VRLPLVRIKGKPVPMVGRSFPVVGLLPTRHSPSSLLSNPLFSQAKQYDVFVRPWYGVRARGR